MIGINIFVYLARGTQKIGDFLDKMVDKIAEIFGTSVSSACNDILRVIVVGAQSASNAEMATEFASAIVGSGTVLASSSSSDTSANVQPNVATSSLTTSNTSNENITSQFAMPNNSSYAQGSSSKQYNGNSDSNDIAADNADSNIQKGGGGTAGTAGWCFVGDDQGYRSCAQVNKGDKCMSGDIFPSQDICINPNLRS